MFHLLAASTREPNVRFIPSFIRFPQKYPCSLDLYIALYA